MKEPKIWLAASIAAAILAGCEIGGGAPQPADRDARMVVTAPDSERVSAACGADCAGACATCAARYLAGPCDVCGVCAAHGCF